MADTPMIMALDLASISGWACGKPGEKPAHGSIRFASIGASHEAIFHNAYQWMMAKVCEYHPKVVIWEAPLPASFRRGRTTVDTTSLLFGLPAIIGAAAYCCGVYDARKADTRDVRMHFIGQNPKRAKAKPLVVRQCRAMGWDVVDDNAADACALWHFMCALIEPKLAVAPTPLFGRGIVSWRATL